MLSVTVKIKHMVEPPWRPHNTKSLLFERSWGTAPTSH